MASDGDATLTACLCVILQKLSLRECAKPLYQKGDLRGMMISISHSGSSDFILANAKSIVANTADCDSMSITAEIVANTADSFTAEISSDAFE